MDLFRIALAVSTLLTALVAGFLVAFAVVVMPGIRSLEDREFLQAFKVMDRVIQNNQPVFMALWVGSIVAVAGISGFSLWQSDGMARPSLISGAVIFFVGVQWPTLKINIPLNNHLQILDLDHLSEQELHRVRKDFEDPWIRWNRIRAIFATLSALLFILQCLQPLMPA